MGGPGREIRWRGLAKLPPRRDHGSPLFPLPPTGTRAAAGCPKGLAAGLPFRGPGALFNSDFFSSARAERQAQKAGGWSRDPTSPAADQFSGESAAAFLAQPQTGPGPIFARFDRPRPWLAHRPPSTALERGAWGSQWQNLLRIWSRGDPARGPFRGTPSACRNRKGSTEGDRLCSAGSSASINWSPFRAIAPRAVIAGAGERPAGPPGLPTTPGPDYCRALPACPGRRHLCRLPRCPHHQGRL